VPKCLILFTVIFSNVFLMLSCCHNSATWRTCRGAYRACRILPPY